jgi:hypothetical protein
MSAAAPRRTTRAARALVAVGLVGTALACKPPWVPGIDPRSLVEPGTGTAPDSALSTMMRDVIEALETDPCRVYGIVTDRAQTFDPEFEHYLTLSQRLAADLCNHQEPGIRILAAADGAPEWSPVLSVIQVGHAIWVQRGEPTTFRIDVGASSEPCPNEWVSEEYIVEGWTDVALRLTAPSGYRIERYVPGNTRNCDAFADPVELQVGPDTVESFVVRGPEPTRPLSLQVEPLAGPLGAVTYIPGLPWSTTLDLGYNTVPGSSFPGGEACGGQLPTEPSVALRVPPGVTGSVNLTLSSSGDAYLLVVAPNGTVYCDDDSGGGLDSQLFLPLTEGIWDVYAGAFSGEAIPGAVLSYQ